MSEIPSPEILIKYHKTINETGEFPTRLLIPETNFTTAFYKLRYLGINIIMDKAKVNYSCVCIFHAYKLEERLEELELKREEVKI